MAKKTKSTAPKKKSSNKILCKDGKIKKKIPKLFTLFKCGICNKEFSDKYNLTSHEKTHSTETPFACPQCPYRGKTKKYTARHVRRVHGNKRDHKCDVCGKLFHFESGLKVHAMVHSGEKPHVCNVCGKTFRVTYSLNSHMLIHMNEKPFQCSFCDYACRDNSTLRKHQNRHMGLEQLYLCKFCNKPYKNKTALKIHISETHLEVNVRKFPCDRCDLVFKTMSQKNQHIKSVHDKILVCNCPICGARLANKHNLPAHMTKHLDERPFSCTYPGCTSTFKDKGYLHKHSFIHKTKLHYPCSFCGRKFSRQSRRDRHERILHVDRKRAVTCDYCGSSFYTKNYLIKHIQTKHIHKQKFKYICDICGLKTYNKPSIVMHLKYGHNNDDDMICKICDDHKVFKKHLYLKLHYWKSHNIKYKMNRTVKKKEKKPMIEIKVEPVEADFEDMELMDVDKKETEEFDSLDYSKRVLSEDIVEASQRRDTIPSEVEFDELFIRHVCKQHDKPPEPTNEGINEEKVQYVKRKIKQILIRTEKVQKAKELRRKKKKEDALRKEREAKEAKLREEKERQEIIELKRVREMYNERMKAAVVREKKKGPVKITYLKNKDADVDENGKNNDTETIPAKSNDTASNNDENNDVDNTALFYSKYNEDSADIVEKHGESLISNDISRIVPEKTSNSTENIDKYEEGKTSEATPNDNDFDVIDKLDNNDLESTDKSTNYSDKMATDNYQESQSRKDTPNDDDLIDKLENDNDTDEKSQESIQSSVKDNLNEFKNGHTDNNDIEKDNLHPNDDDFSNKPTINGNETEIHEEIDDDNGSDDDKMQSDDESWKNSESDDEEILGKSKKIKFNSHQCYVCFKLYPTKDELIKHCEDHFDICNERTLTKCPICSHVSFKSIAGHMKKAHNVNIKIPIFKIQDRKNTEQGSRYCYEVNGTTVEVIPSIKILNKTASDEIDRKKRVLVNNTVAKTKLVKKGKEWVVEKVAVDIKYDEMPEFDDKTLAKCKVSDNDVDRLGQLNYIAKKKGLKIMFPCFNCDKVCQNFSALKLHKRRHEENPKPFAPRVKNRKKIAKKVKLNIANRTAYPKPIVNKHNCDKKLKDFFESNIRGGDVEFWQFLKIFNKMDREKVNDFKDLEDRTDFGIHYYKNNELENNDNDLGNNDNDLGNNDDELESNDDRSEVPPEVERKRQKKAMKSRKCKNKKK